MSNTNIQTPKTELSEVFQADNANTIDFISTIASSLTHYDYISTRDSENFRLAISGVSSRSSSIDHPTSLFNELCRLSDKVTGSSLEILGEEGFYASMLGLGFSSFTEMLIKDLAQLGNELISNTKLYFNRPLTLKTKTRNLDSRLASTYNEKVISDLEKSITNLTELSRHTLYAQPLTVDVELILDHIINNSSFDTLKVSESPFREFRTNAKTFLTQYETTIANLTHAYLQIATTEKNLVNKIQLNQQMICAKVEELNSLYTQFQLDLEGFDLQRTAILKRLRELTEQQNLFSDMLSKFSKTVAKTVQTNQLFEKERRLIRLMLISKDHSTDVAKTATEDLAIYLRQNNTSISKIIQQELKRIHPALEDLDLEKFKSESESLVGGDSAQKTRALDSLTGISNRFSGVLSTLCILILMAAMQGCGIKGDPRSITEAIRPEIPFKPRPTSNIKLNKKDPGAENPQDNVKQK